MIKNSEIMATSQGGEENVVDVQQHVEDQQRPTGTQRRFSMRDAEFPKLQSIPVEVYN